MRILRPLLLTALPWLGLSAGQAQALPIQHDKGNILIYLTDLPDNSPLLQLQNKEAKAQPDKLGYRFWRLRIFWLPIWTANGQFVVYSGTERHPQGEKGVGQDVQMVARLTGVPLDRLQTPLAYTCPVGWLVVAALVLLIAFGSMVHPGKQPATAPSLVQGETSDVNALLADERYQQALKVIHEGTTSTEPNREDIERGLQWLTSQGIPREEAEANLAVLLEAVHR
jgi:hypothetical protein